MPKKRYQTMKNKNYYQEPVLFISRTGAAKIGIKLLARLPYYINSFEVHGPIHLNGDTGYYLYLIPANCNEIPEPVNSETLQLIAVCN